MTTVTYSIHEIPPTSKERLAELRALADRPYSEIDLTDPDAPETTKEELAQMRPARLKIGFYKETAAEVQ